MTQANSKLKEISIGGDFGDVVVKVNGAQLEVDSDGSIPAYNNGTVKVQPVAHDVTSLDPTAPIPADKIPKGNRAADAIGSIVPDGSIYAGISPDTNKPMCASPADVPLTMTSPLEFYGTTIIDDPIMGPRPFAFIKRVEDKGVSRWPMTAEYVAHLKDTFSAASADDDYARTSLAAVAAAEKALASEGNRRGLGASPFIFPDDHVFIQCDGYRTVSDPDLGPRVFAMLRQRFPSDGFVVRRPATAEELQGITDHFREHAFGSESDNHGMSKSEFRKAAEFIDGILAEVKARKPAP